ncbi:MAG: membrane lipoprotein lipid attachment site-containing protein [Bacteroidales bacterium]|nr:membrane lipoprotein lipid attachment site-containing protein [Bacteroidales bacterium]
MKRLIYTLGALAILAGCSDIIDNPSLEEGGRVFKAITEASSPDTKTTLDNGKIVWSAWDEILILGPSAGRYYLRGDSEGKPEAEFREVGDYSLPINPSLSTNVALYPFPNDPEYIFEDYNLYDLDVTEQGDGTYRFDNVIIPPIQLYAPDSFNDGFFPMVAVSGTAEDHTLNFKNVLGGVKIQLTGNASIRTIVFRGNNDETIAGRASIIASADSDPVITVGTVEYFKNIRLEVDDIPLNETEPETFLVTLPPMTFTNGFTVEVVDVDGNVMEIRTNKPKTIVRSSNLKMSAVRFAPNVKEPQGEYEYVDLGLPSGTLWASMNVGATKPEESGDYFAWGETSPKSSYNFNNYKYQKTCVDRGLSGGVVIEVEVENYTKYVMEPSAYYDMARTLRFSDDAANANWGGAWRMPSMDEIWELVFECDWTYEQVNGVSGYRVSGPAEGKSIFLPCTGYMNEEGLQDEGTFGLTLGNINYDWQTDKACCLHYGKFNYGGEIVDDATWDPMPRFYGVPVRPVYDKSLER